MISILVDGPIMPSGVLAVDGSPRTFICDVVVPSCGALVDTWVGCAGGSFDGGSELGGREAVIMKPVGEAESGVDKLRLQLDASRAAVDIMKNIFFTRQL
jgi:hypothetical protein